MLEEPGQFAWQPSVLLGHARPLPACYEAAVTAVRVVDESDGRRAHVRLRGQPAFVDEWVVKCLLTFKMVFYLGGGGG